MAIAPCGCWVWGMGDSLSDCLMSDRPCDERRRLDDEVVRAQRVRNDHVAAANRAIRAIREQAEERKP